MIHLQRVIRGAVLFLIGIGALWGVLKIRQPQLDANKFNAIGSINGVRIKVPGEYRGVGLEYVGESFWAPKKRPKPVRTADSPISSFPLHMKWPELESPQSDQISYETRDKINGSKQWLIVQVEANGAESAEHKRILKDLEPWFGSEFPFARLVALRLDEMPKRWPGMHYKHSKFVPELGMTRAIPEGPHAATPKLYNRDLYWTPEGSSEVAYVECAGSQWQNRMSWHKKCTHWYRIKELRATVTVRYNVALLPEWRSIQKRTHAFVLNLRVP